MMRIRFILAAALPALFLVQSTLPSFADVQVEVNGNGDSSQNTVPTSLTQNTTITQTNDANINNSISSAADTGENTANDNGEDVQMSTGDSDSQTQVSNTLNSNSVTTPCCESTLDITIDGNGANSVNTIHTELTNTTTIHVTQMASITNNINLLGNTGNNRASNNNGAVEIKTGDIKGTGVIQNVVNQAQVTVSPGAWDIHVINRDNGVDSTNVIVVDLVNDFLLWRTDVANINNTIYADFNTGGNTASGNLSNVFIDTGNVDFSFDIVNGPAYIGGSEVLCCDDGAPVQSGDNPGPNSAPPPQTGGQLNFSGSSSNGSSKTAGEVLGALTQVLPATGASAIHFWIMAVVYLIIFLSGLYLRLRAGRSPTILRPAFTGFHLLAY